MKTYDVISIGSASIDVFIRTASKDVEFEKIHSHEDVCLPIGAKILLDKLYTEPGGSGVNTSIAFARLGFKAAVVTKLGKDANAGIVQKILKKEHVDFLGKIAAGKTGYSVIFSGLHKNRTILTYKGNNDKLNTKDVSLNKRKTKWFYFGTLLGQSWKTQCKIAKYAKKHGVKILFNPSLYLAEKGYKYLKPILDACTILVLNKEEAQALTGKKGGTAVLLDELQQKIPIVVITDGPKGAHAFDGRNMYSIVPTDVPITDTTGAGDSFASAFLAAIMLNKDIPTALRWGAAQANSVIQYYGATNILLNKKQIIQHAKRAGRVRKEV